MTHKPKVLVCPLDWGIGHASRMVPVIRELLDQGAEVHIGAYGRSLAFLQIEFPALPHHEFKGYPVVYPGNKRGMVWKIMRQFPDLLRWTRKEHSQLERLVVKHRFNGVISDNRFGLWSVQVPCVFVTHQVYIQTPQLLKFLAPVINRLNRNYIGKYRECWIPDNEGKLNLSGILSHRKDLPSHCHFIGPLSRFFAMNLTQDGGGNDPVQYDVLVMLSGPEPQRSILEKKILSAISPLNIKVAMVLGKPDAGEISQHTRNCDTYTHLESQALLGLIRRSRIIVSRSGYSTIMDLVATGSRAVLIPTPGQTEQEYLARYLMERNYYFSVSQDKFDLEEALEKIENYPGVTLDFDRNILKSRITNFLQMT